MNNICFHVFYCSCGHFWVLGDVVCSDGLAIAVEESSSLDPNFIPFSFFFTKFTFCFYKGTRSSHLSCFECIVVIENALLKLNFVIEHFGLKGLILFFMKYEVLV